MGKPFGGRSFVKAIFPLASADREFLDGKAFQVVALNTEIYSLT
jgi:hypothetical protein